MPAHDDPGPLPGQHPRNVIERKADREIIDALLAIRRKYKLTALEYQRILANEMSLNLRFALRAERHPEDTDRCADEE